MFLPSPPLPAIFLQRLKPIELHIIVIIIKARDVSHNVETFLTPSRMDMIFTYYFIVDMKCVKPKYNVDTNFAFSKINQN
jgi:hypothetical protein